MHPLHDEKFLLNQLLNQGYIDGLRMTGRTTVRALRSLADAIENPGKEIPVFDHSDGVNWGRRNYKQRDVAVARLALDMAHKLGLEHISSRMGEPVLTFGKLR